jgi:hypothetical protein
MRIRILTAITATLFGVLAVFAPSATAGSDNGTTNWYSSDRCDASGGNLVVTNYDIRYNGTTWQEYHIDADRAGGVGSAPKVYIRQTGTSTWRLLSYWNDFVIQQSNEWIFNDFKVVFANGSSCVIPSL